MPAPVALVPVAPVILSSYGRDGKTGGPRANLRPLVETKMGVCAPEVAPALLALHNAVTAAGGDFRVTELHRDVSVQVAARAKYDRWVAAGKPSRTSPNYNASTMKADFVALPGKSMHNGGRAIDFHVGMTNFPGVPKDKQLDRMWELCKPLGWRPIIKAPDEGASESWHLDYWGELTGVYDRLGYEQGALCGALLVGHAGQWQTYERVVQALLQRAGFSIGEIDGAVGSKTLGALATATGLPIATVKTKTAMKDESFFPSLLALPAK
jgi:hypothetical protein